VPPIVDVGPVDGIVLLVEDEAPVRAFASRALQLRGFKVLEADSGEEALEVLKEEARKTRPDMKVVFVSGYSEENFSENESHIPNSVFLPKPFSLDQLTYLEFRRSVDTLHRYLFAQPSFHKVFKKVQRLVLEQVLNQQLALMVRYELRLRA